MRLYKVLLTTIFLFSLSAVTSFQGSAKEKDSGLISDAASGILIDASTGKLLYEKNIHKRLAPASMTKIMTMSIIFDHIKDGNLSFEDYITTSEHAASMGGSQIFLEVGERMTLEDMLKAIAISSANDAAVAVAERIAGTEGMFVQMMNEKTKNLGLTNTNFMDVTGLESTNHFSSAYDMAVMSRYLINTHGENVLRFTSIRTDRLREEGDSYFQLDNTNKLIGKVEGVDGLKTGWTRAAGYSLAATKKLNGNRLISVVMGYENSNDRNDQTIELLNYGFANFKFNEIIPINHVVKEITNIKFNPTTFQIVTSRSVIIVDKFNEQAPNFRYEIILNEFETSMQPGQVVGYLEIFVDNVLIDTVELIVIQNIRENNFFEVVLQIIKMILA